MSQSLFMGFSIVLGVFFVHMSLKMCYCVIVLLKMCNFNPSCGSEPLHHYKRAFLVFNLFALNIRLLTSP